MSYDDGFLLPGLFDAVQEADAATLHEAGLDDRYIRHDPTDDYGTQLPQFGPAFVPFVHQRISELEEKIDKALGKWSYEPVTVVLFGSMNADSNGNIARNLQSNAILYEPPPGFTLALHRLTISCTGNNFGTPFNVAAGYWELRVNDEMLDGGSLVAPAAGVTGGSFPVARTWGTRDALRVRDGEVLSLFVSGTNTFAGKSVTVRGQGTLDRTPEG